MSDYGVNWSDQFRQSQDGATVPSLAALQAQVQEQEDRLRVLERLAREALEQRTILEQRLEALERRGESVTVPQSRAETSEASDLEWKPAPRAPEPEMPHIDLSSLLASSFRVEDSEDTADHSAEGVSSVSNRVAITLAEPADEAEEWRPEGVKNAAKRAEIPIDWEWKPEVGAEPAARSTPAVDAVCAEPEISARPGLLFKGRYTDVVWPQDMEAEEQAELERCTALSEEEARAALDRAMRKFPYAWRIRQRLFALELAAGHTLYAYTAGWPLLYAPLPRPDKQHFREQMTGVIEAMFSGVATPSERRWKSLRLAELIMDVDPQEALARIREGLSQGEVTIEEESRLHYYRLCLADSCRESFDDCVIALQNIDGRVHLFEDLQRTVERYCPGHTAIVSLIDSLLHHGHDASKDLEKNCNLGGEGFKPQLVETEHDDKADMLVELIFNQIYKRIPMPDVESHTPQEEEILQQSESLQPVQFPVVGLANRLNRTMFGVKCDVRVYSGPEPFLANIIVGPTPTLVLHRQIAELRPVEQQALLLRRLFQMHHRHHIIRRIHDVMSNDDRLVMMHALCQVAKDSGADPGADSMALLDSLKPSESGFLDKLERLSNSITLHTGIFEFLAGRELMFAKRPFNKLLDGASDRFVARVVGMTEASYSVALTAVGGGELYDDLMETGFSALYLPANSREFLLRLRLQRLWVAPLQEELWF